MAAMKVRREALLRQMTPEQRGRALADSTYVPPGPWSFGPSDFVSDETTTAERYAAAPAVMSERAAAHGDSSLTEWYRSLWTAPRPLTTEALVTSARAALSVDVAQRLR